MKKKAFLLAPAVALGLSAMAGSPAMAADASGSYSTTLNQLNNSGASGTAWVEVNGTQATVTVQTSGLAQTFMDAPYPHVQHIHVGAQGTCPTMADDANGDGVLSTMEGHPAYGMIGTTLSLEGSTGPEAGTDIKVAPSGSSFTYERTFELNQETQDSLANGTAVVVVHGLDPATQPAAATETMSELPGAESLPLAATAPALCGPLQMQPAGGADTGVEVAAAGETAATTDAGAVALGGAGLLAALGGAYAVRRRMVADR
ncbi:hypothetical protein SAMN04488693_12911 [Arthrobacter subterraneus]|uniref:CHRD domain-containing protein n=1 Tax=Arthrobacter subterraneus TaxID=335973 RepID=A0A1G8P695_9MICC|nr:CHRD domain-containing protein [Arthrobacter subterraneus]SDI87310.1 hypothetical protein SAMN04488693_12911 [Arthrobacter subterraneus]